jgi:hypoxanthine phosphoribosyltransferase
MKKKDGSNIPIQAIGLSLYERPAKNSVEEDSVEEVPGTEVKRLQWLDVNSSMANLIGKNVLIVDEVDDTRRTLQYAVEELQKDVEVAKKQLPPGSSVKGKEETKETKFHVFVLHVCACLSAG